MEGRYTRVVFWGMRTMCVRCAYDQQNYRTHIVRIPYVLVTVVTKSRYQNVRRSYDVRTAHVRLAYDSQINEKLRRKFN